MVRYGLSIAMLFAVVVWLVLSYVPGAEAMLPGVAFGGAWATTVLPMLAAATLAGMVAIQAILLYGTGKLLHHPADSALAVTLQQFGLRYGREMFLSALPLILTVLLAAILYWLAL